MKIIRPYGQTRFVKKTSISDAADATELQRLVQESTKKSDGVGGTVEVADHLKRESLLRSLYVSLIDQMFSKPRKVQQPKSGETRAEIQKRERGNNRNRAIGYLRVHFFQLYTRGRFDALEATEKKRLEEKIVGLPKGVFRDYESLPKIDRNIKLLSFFKKHTLDQPHFQSLKDKLNSKIEEGIPDNGGRQRKVQGQRKKKPFTQLAFSSLAENLTSQPLPQYLQDHCKAIEDYIQLKQKNWQHSIVPKYGHDKSDIRNELLKLLFLSNWGGNTHETDKGLFSAEECRENFATEKFCKHLHTIIEATLKDLQPEGGKTKKPPTYNIYKKVLLSEIKVYCKERYDWYIDQKKYFKPTDLHQNKTNHLKRTLQSLYQRSLKEILKNLFSRSLKIENIRKKLPELDYLHKRAIGKIRSKALQYAIHHGRLLHYHEGDLPRTSQIASEKAFENQHLEHLVKDFIIFVSFAQRSLQQLYQDSKGDCLGKEIKTISDLESCKNLLQLIFPERISVHLSNYNESKLAQFIFGELSGPLYQLRNRSFHFQQAQELHQVMGQESVDSVSTAAVSEQWAVDALQERTEAQFEQWQAHEIFTKKQIDDLLNLWSCGLDDLSLQTQALLPRFNKLAQRAKNVKEDWKKSGVAGFDSSILNDLPLPISQDLTNAAQSPTSVACYSVLKQLYQEHFASWLDNATQQGEINIQNYLDLIRGFREKAHQSNKLDADTVAIGQFQIPAGMKRLSDIFVHLTRIMSVKAQAKNNENGGLYNLDPEQLSEEMRSLENLRIDITLLAWCDFIKTKALGFLPALMGEDPKQRKRETQEYYQSAREVTEIIRKKQEQRPVTVASLKIYPQLFLWLFLAPVQCISRLQLSIRKYYSYCQRENVVSDTAKTTGLDRVYRTLILYLRLHDTDVINAPLAEQEKDFIRKFLADEDSAALLREYYGDTSAANQLIPRRGIRELCRFAADRDAIARAFTGKGQWEQVSSEDLDRFQSLASETPKAHREKESARSSLIHMRGNKENLEEIKKHQTNYIKNLQLLTEYRNLKHRVHLHEPLEAYRLMMQIQSRCIEYCFFFERDAYFASRYRQYLDLTEHAEEGEATQRETLKQAHDQWQSIYATHLMGYLNSSEPNALIKNKRSRFPLIKGDNDQQNAIQPLRSLLRFQDENSRNGAIQARLEEWIPLSDNGGGNQNRNQNNGIRNYLAHFNNLDKDKKVGSYALNSMLYALRYLMGYDRKIKNRIIPSICHILAQHHFTATTEVKDKSLVIQALRQERIQHLKKVKKGKKILLNKKSEVIMQLSAEPGLKVDNGALYEFLHSSHLLNALNVLFGLSDTTS